MLARAAENGLGQPQRAMLDAMQRLVMDTDLEVEALQPVSPEELASQLNDPALARRVLELRAEFLEGRLIGDADLASRAAELAAAEVKPIDDVRSSAQYRRWVTGNLVARFLRSLQ